MNTKIDTESVVWYFGQAEEIDRKTLFAEIKKGKHRFGWSHLPHHNLNKYPDYEENFKQLRLLDIEVGDWIIRRNCPEYAQHSVMQVSGYYKFDKGIPNLKDRRKYNFDRDFLHYIPIDPSTLVIFERSDNFTKKMPRGRIRRLGKHKKLFFKILKEKMHGKN